MNASAATLTPDLSVNSTSPEEYFLLRTPNFTGEGGNDISEILERLDKMREVVVEYENMCALATSIANNYLWVLLAIGAPANILTIITILTMQAVNPATFFVALLAFFDGATLMTKTTIYFLPRYAPEIVSDTICRMEFLAVALATIANWMLVSICAERFVSVCFPLQKVYLFTKRLSYILASVVIVFFLVFYGIVFCIVRRGKLGVCMPQDHFKHFWEKYYFAINASFVMFIPFLIILGLTIGIIRGLHISRRERRTLLRRNSQSVNGVNKTARSNKGLLDEAERTERAITVMMTLTAALFLILTLPSSILFFITSYENTAVSISCQSIKFASWAILTQIQYVLIDSTHAVNFFMYFLAFKRFRVHLIKLLTCKKFGKKKYRYRHQHTISSQLSTSSKVNHSIIPQSPCREIA